jgi:23S rRNA (cytidine1920-2'-O)/16S rRNA (cytidine1409-2'-O)-methyltransferase
MPRVPRLDLVLAERGLAPSRTSAQALIMAGRVRVEGALVTKAGTPVAADADVAVTEGARFVSRGGDKLAHALDVLEVSVAGACALDVGASTGGFTDCLLQAGASEVVALDVGRGQLHERLRTDPRVHVNEGLNVRGLEPSDLPFAPDLATIDVSFISLSLVLGPVLGVLRRPYLVLPLVKPQFEAGRDRAPGGVVRDPAVRLEVARQAAARAVELGAVVVGACDSGHPGPAGNRELFLLLASPDHPRAAEAPDDLEETLVRAAG